MMAMVMNLMVVKMMNKTFNILGTEYTVEYKKDNEDDVLKDSNGYCDITSKKIVILAEKRNTDDVDDFKYLQRKTMRHEIIHAFIFESGLFTNTYCVDGGWAKNEEMVDWIAIQFPKILKVFMELGCDT